MSITGFVRRVCVQTAVYWGNPQPDGIGGYTYDDAEEISCRWEDKEKVIINDQGEAIITNAEVLVTEDLDFGGILYLGTLEEIEDSAIDPPSPCLYPQPYQLESLHLHRIVTKERIPLFRSTTKFVHMVYLRPNWESKI